MGEGQHDQQENDGIQNTCSSWLGLLLNTTKLPWRIGDRYAARHVEGVPVDDQGFAVDLLYIDRRKPPRFNHGNLLACVASYRDIICSLGHTIGGVLLVIGEMLRIFCACDRPDFLADSRGAISVRKSIWLLVIAALQSPPVRGARELQVISASEPQNRRPVAAASLDESMAVVANRRGGTLSVLDVKRWVVKTEFDLAGKPTDLAMHGRNLLVTDANAGRLLSLKVDRSSAEVLWKLPVPPHPVSVRVSPDGTWCSVCSLWSRRVTFVRLSSRPEESPQVIATVELPFAPREQLILRRPSQLLVADAFGGRLAVIDIASHKLRATFSLPGHNIRGLVSSPDGKQVIVTHQLLDEHAPPRRSEIIWGVMMSDAMRVIPRENFLDPKADVLNGARFVMIGNGTRGAGDPGAIVPRSDGRLAVALAGTSEVAIVSPDGFKSTRIPVQRRPVAMIPIGENSLLVVNELSDSVSRIDLKVEPAEGSTKSARAKSERPSSSNEYASRRYKNDKAKDKTYGRDPAYNRAAGESLDLSVEVKHLSLGTTPKPGAAERGEAHFFNARLSRGGWYSCHSCHTDGHSSGGLADTLGDGGEGAPKRILSLLGVADTGPFAWKGNKKRLDIQVHQSLQLTMRGRQLAKPEINDVVEFLKTLKPPPPFKPAESAADQKTIDEGRKLFKSLDCASCHESKTLTSPDTYDVGLTDALGTKRFNPPSLRGVGHRPKLFHDGRATSIEQVIRKYKHQLPRPLSDQKERLLVRYLESL